MIFEHIFKEPIKAEKFKVEDYISYDHNQDCCEWCYIDFEHVDMYRDQIDKLWSVVKMEVVWVKDEWIVVYLYNWEESFWEPRRVWVSLAARNEQNWYYNDEVIVVVKVWNLEFKKDLQELWFVENLIG